MTGLSEDEWIRKEIDRKINKSITNVIGTFQEERWPMLMVLSVTGLEIKMGIAWISLTKNELYLRMLKISLIRLRRLIAKFYMTDLIVFWKYTQTR